jgi:hypothetical protein
MNQIARGLLPEQANEDDFIFLTAKSDKDGTVIRFFVINPIKLWTEQVDSTDKRNRYCAYSNQKGRNPIHLSPIEEEPRRIY